MHPTIGMSNKKVGVRFREIWFRTIRFSTVLFRAILEQNDAAVQGRI